MDSELRPLSSSFIYYKKITNQKLSKGEKWHKKEGASQAYDTPS